jgi:hypothetical protein
MSFGLAPSRYAPGVLLARRVPRGLVLGTLLALLVGSAAGCGNRASVVLPTIATPTIATPTTTLPVGPAPTTTVPLTATTTPSDSTTAIPTTTTAAPITTVAPTTVASTTTAPRSTTTEVPTSTAPTTTSVAPATAKSSTPWGWVLAAALLVLAVLLVVLLIRRANRRRAMLAWSTRMAAVLGTARLARGLLPLSGAEITDDAHWQSVRARAQQAAQSLEGAVSDAPTPETADAARRAGAALQGLVFALESDRLMRDGARPPTGEQLAQADLAIRTRASEFDVAIADIDRIVGPGESGAPGSGSGSAQPGS